VAIMTDRREREISQNFEFFQTLVGSLLPQHFGEFALLRDRSIVGLFPSAVAAMSDGHLRFEDGIFSVQRVVNKPLDLGFLSYGSSDRAAA
jgi:hypothetical protein